MGQRMNRSWRSGLARNQDFVKGEWLEPQVITFYKYLKIWIRGEQIRATQTYHRRNLGDPPPRDYWDVGARPPLFLENLVFPKKRILVIFLEKNSYFNAIWITFCIFSEPFKKAKFLRFESQLKKILPFRSSPKHVKIFAFWVTFRDLAEVRGS